MIKDKIKSGNKIIGTHLTMGNYWIADIFGMSGVDYVWIDTEHGPMDYEKLLQCITVLKAHGTAVFVRTQIDDFNHTKRLLEMGIDGIIFPVVQSAEQAKKCLSYTFYPPKGIRGFGPARAVEYGKINATDYIKNESSLCRFVQIETQTSVEKLESILQNEDIDGFILGPCDMAINCGDGVNYFGNKTLPQIKKAIEILKLHNKYIGVSIGSTDKDHQKEWIKLGVDMISVGGDTAFVFEGINRSVKQLSELCKTEIIY